MALGDTLNNPLGSAPVNKARQSTIQQALINQQITPQEFLQASRVANPGRGASIAGAFAGGQIDPGEFMAANRMYGNPGLSSASRAVAGSGMADDVVKQILNTGTAAQAGPIARSVGGGIGSAAMTAANTAGLVAPLVQSGAAGGAAGAAANVVDDVAAATAGKQGFMSRLFGGGGKLAPAGVLKTALPALGGYLGGQFLGGQDIGGEGSMADRILPGAATGAGIGASVGMLGGPFAGLSVPVGAAIGGAAGGIWGALTGDSSNKEQRMDKAYTGLTTTIQQLGTTYGLSEANMQNVMLEFDAAAQIMLQQGDEDGFKALVDQMEVALPQAMLSYRMEQEQERKQNERMMGIQAQFAPMLNSIVDRSAINSGVAYSQALKAADTLKQSDPGLAALISSNAASSRSNQDALMAAYVQQMAIVPTEQTFAEQQILAANTQPL